MTESWIKPVASIRAADLSIRAKPALTDKADALALRENRGYGPDKASPQMKTDRESGQTLANISIHFNVDEETNRLIVVVTERESGRVIRTIPADELDQLQAGDLLKWTA